MITIPNKPLFIATIVGTILFCAINGPVGLIFTLGVFVGSVKINARS